MENLHDKLDSLEKEIPNLNLINFKFSEDRSYDYTLIDWFIKNGEMRIYKKVIIHEYFVVTLVSFNKLKLHIGNIYSDCISRNEDPYCNWQNEYIRYAWEKLKSFKYCTNNLLKTPDEVLKDFRNDEKYTFSNSKETYRTIEKNTKKCINILNTLIPLNL